MVLTDVLTVCSTKPWGWKMCVEYSKLIEREREKEERKKGWEESVRLCVHIGLGGARSCNPGLGESISK